MGLSDLAAARADTLRLAHGLRADQLGFAPAPGRWSVGEVLDHLLKAEDLYRREIRRLIALKRSGQPPRIRRTLADITVAPAFVPAAAMVWLDLPVRMLNSMVPAGVRDALTENVIVPFKNPAAATPVAGRPGAELIADLERSLAETRELLERNSDIDFRELISEHPLTGVNDVHQILAFVARHERRHHAQIRANFAHRRFPRAAAR